LPARERARALGEVLGAQELAANGTREQVVRRGGGSGEQAGKAKRGQKDTGEFGPAPHEGDGA
jgi:hypothetical protein